MTRGTRVKEATASLVLHAFCTEMLGPCLR